MVPPLTTVLTPRAEIGRRAAQLLLAAELPADDPERAALVEAARNAADELGLSWVLTGLEKLAA